MPILTLLTTLAPLITKLGLGLIDIFVKDQAAKDKAKKDFLDAIHTHLNDAQKSVTLRASYQAQLDDLKKGPSNGA